MAVSFWMFIILNERGTVFTWLNAVAFKIYVVTIRTQPLLDTRKQCL